jgi:hypothetical protein
MNRQASAWTTSPHGEAPLYDGAAISPGVWPDRETKQDWRSWHTIRQQPPLAGSMLVESDGRTEPMNFYRPFSQRSRPLAAE